MASANIRFTQGTTVGQPGKSVLGLSKDANVVMSDASGSAISYNWEFLSWPSPLSDPPTILNNNAQSATALGPFLDGIYIVKLIRVDALGVSQDIKFFGVADSDGLSLPSAGLTSDMCDVGGDTNLGWAGGVAGSSNFLLDAFLRKRRFRERRYSGPVQSYVIDETYANPTTIDLTYGEAAPVQYARVLSATNVTFNIRPQNVEAGASFTFIFEPSNGGVTKITFDGNLLWHENFGGYRAVNIVYLGSQAASLTNRKYGWLVDDSYIKLESHNATVVQSEATDEAIGNDLILRGGRPNSSNSGVYGQVVVQGSNLTLNSQLVYNYTTQSVSAESTIKIVLNKAGYDINPLTFIRLSPSSSFTFTSTPTIETEYWTTPSLSTYPIGAALRLQNVSGTHTIQFEKDSVLGGSRFGTKLALRFNLIELRPREVLEFMWDGTYWTQVGCGGSESPNDLRSFMYSEPGNYVWQKPSDAMFVRFIVVGGGGGGSSGSCGDSSLFRKGGAGGASGGINDVTLPARSLPSSLNLTVGAGGAGGAGVTTVNGMPGFAGESSSLTGIGLTAYGGGAPTLYTSSAYGGAGLYSGNNGFSSLSEVINSEVSPSSSSLGGPGAGGSGGGLDNLDTLGKGVSGCRASLAMGAKGAGYNRGDQTNPNGGAGFNGSEHALNNNTYPSGSGGGGGAGMYSADGGDGGIGGNFGGGGGGGGAARPGYTSGSGGRGGDGGIFIYTW